MGNYTKDEIEILFNDVGNVLITRTFMISGHRFYHSLDRDSMIQLLKFERLRIAK